MLTRTIYPLTKQSISKTVFLPKTRFPQRHDPKKEIKVQEDATFALSYLEQDHTRKCYIIHDGPPFANGQIHLGHAVNKILKDIAARYAMISGHRVEFVTGWDCHGLPIELQVIKQLENQAKETNYGGSAVFDYNESPKTFRTTARQFAKSQIDLQLASFKRMGLLTDWNKRYTTDDPSYVANQLRAFSQLYEQKLIFKDLMPVNWSLVNQNTVADADVDHRPDHISKAAYVLYEIVDPPFPVDLPGDRIYSLIWTTTPWTLLENEAIAFNKQETYCIVKISKPAPSQDVKNLLLSFDSLPKVETIFQRLGYQYEMKTYVPGRSLVGLKYKPLLGCLLPLNGEYCSEPKPFLDADYVDGAKGTGLVHISPNYGQEDFQLMKKNSIPIRTSLVESDGRYSAQVKEMGGKNIFSDGNNEILSLLDQHQRLLFSEQYQHSYPYETRTKTPIITKTSQQIFLDTSRIIPRCLRALESCSFFPEHRKTHFINTLSASPSWCISRQRLWGTPIPVFYDVDDINQKNMISHPLLTEHLCKLLYKRRFMDYWWTIDNSELIPQELLDACKLPCKSENLVRGIDIFDVWSDSGLSWHTTVNHLNDSKTQADLYLEGVDQIRGWFSSSTLMSMALRGCLPTKRFFIHGFTLDEMGRKMSKSQGNVTDPIELFEKHGVDPIRLWVAKKASNHNNICVKTSEFESSIGETIQRFRSTIRFLIGCLNDHDVVDNQLDHTKLELFDQYYLDKLYRFASTVDEHYKNYRYDLAVMTINSFLEEEWSPIYITSIKDQLYCDGIDSPRRKSALTVLNLAYNIFLRCIYPIVPHIVHEAGQYMRSSEPLNEWQNLGHRASWSNRVLHDQYETLISIRQMAFKALGPRLDSLKNHDAFLMLSDKKVSKNFVKLTQSNPDLIAELFKTSTFIISSEDKIPTAGTTVEGPQKYDAGDEDNIYISETAHGFRVGGSITKDGATPLKFEIAYKKSDHKKCPRCRRYCVLHDNQEKNFCDRCANVVSNLDI